MGNLVPISQWGDVPYFEADAVVSGGPECPDNIPIQALLNRTEFLKGAVDGLGNNKQPIAALLTAIAALVTAADKMAYFTGPDQVALTNLTAFARTILGAADAATARGTLGAISAADLDAAINSLVNGAPGALNQLNELAAAMGNDANFAATMTNALAGKQPASANLTALAAPASVANLSAIAGLAGAADKMAYSTGAATWAMTTLSAFARTLIDDADAAAARGTLGVSTGYASSIGAGGGYLKLPDFMGGWILQVGKVDGTQSNTTPSSLSFPIAFPNACIAWVANTKLNGALSANADSCYQSTAISTTGVTYFRQDFNGVNTGSDYGFYWIAIGN